MVDHPIDTSRKAIDTCLFRGSPGWHNRLLRSVADERDAARAEIERLNNALTVAANQISDLAARLGQAEGRLDASELVGVVEGWKARAEKAEAERDEARAQVAAAFEAAAKSLVGRFADLDGDNIRSLTPADAKASIEAYGLEKIREGMRMAADIANSFYQVGQIGADIRAAILDEMEKLK